MDSAAERCESGIRDNSDDEKEWNSCAIDSVSSIITEPMPSIPVFVSHLSKYLNDESLVVFDLESGLQYGVLNRNDIFYVIEWVADKNRVVVADWKNRSMVFEG